MNLKTKIEFNNWVSSQNFDELNSYDKRLLEILYSNFEDLYPEGLRGTIKRSDLIINLIKEVKDEEAIDEFSLDQPSETVETFNYPFEHITSLEVESFRGFIDKDVFEFSKNYNLIFGKNGSGKSSFFEALEYAFLNNIEEAGQRGLQPDKYAINTVTGKFTKPIACYSNEDGDKVRIEVDPNNYQWMFIEKNRINNFSRVSASTPSKQTEIISNLFGLEDFNQFVKNFTPNFSIPKEDENTKRLEELEQEFSSASTNSGTEKDNLETAEERKKKIFDNFEQGDYFDRDITNCDELLTYLNDNEGKKGRITQLNELVLGKDTNVSVNSNIVEEVKKHKDDFLRSATSYYATKKQFDGKIDQINLKDLYEKALGVQNKFKRNCPLCLTPIKGFIRKTKIDPYINANKQLALLKDAEDLKQLKQTKFNNLIDTLARLQQKTLEINQLKEIIENKIDLKIYDAHNVKEETILEVETSIKDCDNLKDEHLSEIKKELEKIEEKSKKQETIISKADLELKHLNDLSSKLTHQDTIIQEIKKRIGKAERVIINFKTKNKDLIENVEKEKKINTGYEEYEKSYQNLYKSLVGYKEKLPLTLIANLNEKVAQYFNLINNHEEEREFELIDKIEFPTKEKNDIIIYFKDEPSKPVNALHVLSEGHLKCLGLAIILAKSVSENAPILVFDDVINAIDDDHREGVRDLLFTNPEINKKQIILTSHGEQFITQTVNEIRKNGEIDKCNEISFILSSEKGIKSIRETTRHYLTNAQLNFNQGKENDCMRDCRYALPSIIFGFWKKLRNKGQDHTIGIKMRYRQEPELYSIVCGINKKCKEISKKTGIDFNGITDILNTLLQQNNWDTLNAASHHQDKDEEKIETKTVKIVFDEINKLGSAVDEF